MGVLKEEIRRSDAVVDGGNAKCDFSHEVV